MKTVLRAYYLLGGLADKLGFASQQAATGRVRTERAFPFADLDAEALEPAPIEPAWILKGTPQARSALLSVGTGGWASTHHWSCTRGKFRWYFAWNETVLFLEGAVTITDEAGNVYHGRPGVSMLFPAGTWAVWDVPDQIRKIAFIQKPVPLHLRAADKITRKLGRLFGLSAKQTGGDLNGA